MDTAVSVRNLIKCKGKKEILHHVNFEVRRGEVMGFLGANGAGKTTTLKCILNLYGYQGEIWLNGINAKREQEKAACFVSGLIEEPCFYPNMSGRENLAVNAMYYGGSLQDRQKKIDRVISELNLEGFVSQRVRTYSLGMSQRLGIAMVLLNEPDIILLDEPMNGLDPDGIRDLRRLLVRLAHDEGKAVLVSSHILSEMQMLCDRVIFIQRGTVVGIQDVSDNLEEQYISVMGGEGGC